MKVSNVDYKMQVKVKKEREKLVLGGWMSAKNVFFSFQLQFWNSSEFFCSRGGKRFVLVFIAELVDGTFP